MGVGVGVEEEVGVEWEVDPFTGISYRVDGPEALEPVGLSLTDEERGLAPGQRRHTGDVDRGGGKGGGRGRGRGKDTKSVSGSVIDSAIGGASVDDEGEAAGGAEEGEEEEEVFPLGDHVDLLTLMHEIARAHSVRSVFHPDADADNENDEDDDASVDDENGDGDDEGDIDEVGDDNGDVSRHPASSLDDDEGLYDEINVDGNEEGNEEEENEEGDIDPLAMGKLSLHSPIYIPVK